MNILHISPYFPSLKTNHAGGVCMGKQIETLMKNNNVYVLTFAASEFDKKLAKEYEKKENYEYVTIKKWTKGLHILMEPFLPNYFAARTSFRFAIKLIKMVRKYHIDAIHAEYASMGQYIWIKKIFPKLKFNLTEHDVTVQSYERKAGMYSGIKKLYFRFQYKLIEIHEKNYCHAADELFTFNDKDKGLIKQFYGRDNTYVLTPYFGLDDDIVMKEMKGKRQYAAVCFMGQMGRDENYLAAMRLIKIGKQVKQDIKELEIYIVGNHPPKELEQEASEYIHITGFVDNLDEYLVNCQLAVFPLTLGAGIKLKVLRSLALGVPVITGKLGAEGIDEEGEVIVLAETDDEIMQEMLRLIKEPAECQRIGKRSKEYIIDNFAWSRTEKVLAEIYGN